MGRSPPHRSSPAPFGARVAGLSVAITACLCLSPLAAQTARSCEDWSIEITAVEGRAEMQRGPGSEWAPLARGQRACSGYTIHVFAGGRVTITLPDGTTFRVEENTTMNLPEPPSGIGSLIELVRGALHVISRDPRLLRFTTPYANAGLEGTEFDIRVDEERKLTEVAVLEGEVVVTTPAGELAAMSGHVVTAREGQAPAVTPYATPIDLMRWAGHYPPVVAGPLPAADQAPMAAEQADAEFFARRAAARLGTARVAAAEDDIATALRTAPRNATALALRALVALEGADRGTARELAARALEADPRSAPALLVLSFVEQRAGELAAAERTIRRALDLEPNNPLALTKLAELAFARGDTRAAIDYATRARTLAPADSTSLVVLGSASLRAFDLRTAHDAFAAAVEVEPQAPLAHLGLGLALLQGGAEQEGRRQLELAVTLDPGDSLMRSYVAKIYGAENRPDLAASQLGLAKEFDPADPTAWAYSAIANLQSNRPVTALQDLRLAADKNRDEPVYRSSFTLDADLAASSAAIGRVYTELGFGRLAQLDAFQSISADPTNYSVHRLLADVYATEPRHEIARISELYVSQLLQPANVTPIKPQLGQMSSFLAQRSGPSQLSFDELDSPVVANGLELRASAVGGGNEMIGHDITLAGLHDRLSYSGGYYRFATDGFRENNDVEQRVGNAFVQYRPNAATSLQAELRAVRGEFGDLTTMFDRQLFSPILRTGEQADSLRFGAKHQLQPNHLLLGSLIVQDAQSQITSGDFYSLDADQNAYAVDAQHLYSAGGVNVQSGLMLARQQTDAITSVQSPAGTDVISTNDDSHQLGLYSYAHFRPAANVTLTAGVAIDEIDGTLVSKDAVSPKLGVMWRPTPRTAIRAAAFEALFGSLTTSMQNTQPRLEPVQLAGFTQLLFGGAADSAAVRGLSIEHELSPQLFVGWQADLREIDRVIVMSFGLGPATTSDVRFDERVQTAYLLWAPRDRLSMSARYEHGRYRSALEIFGYSQMTMERLPLEIRYFGHKGLTAGARVTGIKQHGLFTTPSPIPFTPPVLAPGQDSFSILDAFIGYRLPNRRGFLSLNADNLLDREFQFQDIDPMNPSLIPERLVSFRFTLAFD